MTPPDAVSKWMVITRAAVFSMSVTSGLIGGLLAIRAERLTGDVSVNWGLLAIAIRRLVIAHAANNMINDYLDLAGGIGPWVMRVVLGIPRLLTVLKTYSSPKPEAPPEAYRAGRCSSWATPSSTPAAPAGCSSCACS